MFRLDFLTVIRLVDKLLEHIADKIDKTITQTVGKIIALAIEIKRLRTLAERARRYVQVLRDFIRLEK